MSRKRRRFSAQEKQSIALEAVKGKQTLAEIAAKYQITYLRMQKGFCVVTLSRVLKNGKCEIFNTEQGSQFTSTGFVNMLLDNKIRVIMDGKGRY